MKKILKFFIKCIYLFLNKFFKINFTRVHFFNYIYLFLEKYFKLHLTRVHFYSPIPYSKEITEKDYNKIYNLSGIEINEKYQLDLINKLHSNYFNEFTPYKNKGLSLLDSFILHSMVRKIKPKKIVEIGGGDTTKIILDALKLNQNNLTNFQFFSIDPFFDNSNLTSNNEINLNILRKNVQDVPLDFFQDVDFLFIDSSHISKIGSDVNYIVLEIIPNLKMNTLIHWHDIHFPKNYPKEWIENISKNMFWNESYLVHSFLLFNEKFKIIYAGKYLQLNFFDFLKNKFPYLSKNHSLTSFYIQRIK